MLEAVRAPAATAHVLNFYDGDEELLAGACAFLLDGLHNDEVVLTIAPEAHRQAIAAVLSHEGFDLERLENDGLYIPLDAATVMRSFTVDGVVDRELARQAVLPFALAAASKRRPVRAFGQIVSIMLQSGQIDDALVIEDVRSQLAREFDISLYCAYPSRLAHEAQSLHALGELCAMHNHLVPPASYAAHGLGASPVSVTAQSFLPVHNAIGAARNFVIASMRGWDLSELLVGTTAVSVVQVLTQILGARLRAFRVGLSALSRGVRVQIEYLAADEDGAMSTYGAFGLLDRVAKEWGAEHNRDTKVVWAVFT